MPTIIKALQYLKTGKGSPIVLFLSPVTFLLVYGIFLVVIVLPLILINAYVLAESILIAFTSAVAILTIILYPAGFILSIYQLYKRLGDKTLNILAILFYVLLTPVVIIFGAVTSLID